MNTFIIIVNANLIRQSGVAPHYKLPTLLPPLSLLSKLSETKTFNLFYHKAIDDYMSPLSTIDDIGAQRWHFILTLN